MPANLPRLLRRVGAGQLMALLLMAVVAGSVWAFIAIAEEVGEGDTHAFDKALLLALRSPNDVAQPIGPLWLQLSCTMSRRWAASRT